MAEPIAEDEIKKRATRRLIVAVTLVVLAAGILTWLSQHKPAPPITRPPEETVPPPIIAPPASSEPEAAAAPPGQTAPDTPPPGEPTVEHAPQQAATATAPAIPAPKQAGTLPPTLGAPPPPQVVSKPLPPPGPGPKAPPAEVAKPLVKAEPPTSLAPAPAAVPHAASGYVVQFGVFANPQNALQLVERLRAAGIEAQTETRVMLPPFKTRAEAEAALARLKEKGIPAVVVAR
ncbi:SPOR domain-containing protein [Thiobacter aerophilum]|uniref:SPOR domain-containing protein n=1 Tax=Thiobacter aerophilum TaxID=3121275 RepID=A0ABV0EFU5_9BURK